MNDTAVEPNRYRDFVVNRLLPGSASSSSLRTGAQFRESLRDGRSVIVNGRDIPDVTEEPFLARGIDTLARYFDAQHAPETRDQLTTVDPATGERYSTAWLVPRTIEDLW